MKKVCKFLAIVLVLTLISSVLFACNKDKDKAEKERNQAVESVGNAFLTGVNEHWSLSMSDEEVCSLSDAGDYVVTGGWTQLVLDVIKNSPMQTAKINTLANQLASEDGKALLKEFSSNAELIIPMLKEVGFTSSDISSLAFSLIQQLIQSGEGTLSNMISRLDRVRDLLYQNGADSEGYFAIIDNIDQNRASAELAKGAIAMTESEKQSILSALSDAKAPFDQLVTFAYDSSIGTITDELYDKLFDQSGALGSITEDELSIVVRSLLSNFETLRDALTAEDVAKLNGALNLFIEHFDKNSISSTLYTQIVRYAKYAYMIVDVIPSICDVVCSASDVISDVQFITDMLTSGKLASDGTIDDTTSAINGVILASKAIVGVMQSGTFTKDSICALIEKISVSGQDAYQKAMPIVALDLLLNVSSLIEGSESDVFAPAHPDVLTQDALYTMLAGLLLNGYVDQFKQAYYDYTMSSTTQNYNNMINMANMCSFKNFTDDTNPYSASTQTELWYNWYMSLLPSANRQIADCIDVVKDDLKAFVDDYFAQDSQIKNAIDTIASWTVLSQNVTEEQVENTYIPLFKQSRVLGFMILFMA